jgi:hypothetical protein
MLGQADKSDYVRSATLQPSRVGIAASLKTHYGRCLDAPQPKLWDQLLLQLDSSGEEGQFRGAIER